MEKETEYLTLYRNLPGSDLWEGSFYEKLTEHGIWDEDEFWRLHLDLTHIAQNIKGETISRELACAIVKLYSRISSLISAQLNINDMFVISNLSQDQLFAYRERLEMAVVGVFSGEVLDESSFDLQSPFLRSP